MRAHNNHKKKITTYFQNTVEMEKIVFKKKYSVVVSTFFLLYNFRASSMFSSAAPVSSEAVHAGWRRLLPRLSDQPPCQGGRLDWTLPGDPVPLKKLDRL